MTREEAKKEIDDIRVVLKGAWVSNAFNQTHSEAHRALSLCERLLSLIPASPPPLPGGWKGPFEASKLINVDSDGWKVKDADGNYILLDVGKTSALFFSDLLNHTYGGSKP